jgi:hypothetical protein
MFRRNSDRRRLSSTRRAKPASLAVERLEDRLPMAGDVAVAFNAGILTIDGDNQANFLWVVQDGGRTIVAPSPFERGGQTRLRFRGAILNAPLQLEGVQAISVNLNGGDDDFVMNRAAGLQPNFRSLTVRGGSGNNRLEVWGVQVTQNMAVIGDVGRDAIRLNDVSVGGTLTVNGGQGDNELRLMRTQAAVIQIAAGSGHDLIDVRDANALSRLRVLPGDGNNLIDIASVGVSGQVEITTGVGDDWITLGALSGTAAIAIITGAGDDRVFTPENGDDIVLADIVLGQSLTVDMGLGDDRAYLSQIGIDGPVTVNGGAGYTEVVVTRADIGGRLTIVGGDDTTRIRLLTVLVGQGIEVTSGLGNDLLRVSDSETPGEFLVRMGGGNDTVQLSNVTAGIADIGLGMGEDFLFLWQTYFGEIRRIGGGADRDTIRYPVNEFNPASFLGFEVLSPYNYGK